MSNGSAKFVAAAPLVAFCAWLLPGSGYWLIGQSLRGTVICVTIVILFMGGIAIGGIRVIDVPGFDDHGYAIYVNSAGQKVSRAEQGDWALKSRPFAEIANKPWFVGQILAGPMCLATAHRSLLESHTPIVTEGRTDLGVPRSHARIFEIGTLYTAIAGMLNLLAIIDSSYRAGQVPK
jgi:hypothetical protein